MDERDKTKGREFLRSKFAKGISAENKSLYKKAWAKGDSKSKALKAKKHKGNFFSEHDPGTTAMKRGVRFGDTKGS